MCRLTGSKFSTNFSSSGNILNNFRFSIVSTLTVLSCHTKVDFLMDFFFISHSSNLITRPAVISRRKNARSSARAALAAGRLLDRLTAFCISFFSCFSFLDIGILLIVDFRLFLSCGRRRIFAGRGPQLFDYVYCFTYWGPFTIRTVSILYKQGFKRWFMPWKVINFKVRENNQTGYLIS